MSSSAARPEQYSKFAWSTAFFMTLFHVGAVLALFNSPGPGSPSFSSPTTSRSSLGIGMSYHRLLTHRSYKTPKAVEYFLTVCATLALEGGPLFWVATHRRHHQHSDADHDPHTPRHGGFWAHMGWILFGDAMHNDITITARYAPDLGARSFPRLDQQVPLGAADDARPRAAGARRLELGALGRLPAHDARPARHVAGQLGDAPVGLAPLRDPDDSRNSWWVAALTFGEGWHNNHHAHPTSAAHGLAWYEIDITYLHIRALELLGLATHVRRASSQTRHST